MNHIKVESFFLCLTVSMPVEVLIVLSPIC